MTWDKASLPEEDAHSMNQKAAVEKRFEELDSSDGSEGRPIGLAEEQAPVDRYWLVYCIILINGIGVLLPWNMFITIAPSYYVDFWFSPNGIENSYGKQFMSAMGITAQIPNFVMSVVSVLAIIKGPILWRIAGSLTLNCLLVGVILVLVIVQQPTDQAMHWFFIVSLIIVMTMNASNGLYQNSMFGLAADLPFAYTNALVVGSNICGTFTSVVSIITTLALNNAIRTVALIYFSISLGTLGVCGASLWIVTKLEFFQYYVRKGEKARAADQSERPSLKQYWETIKHCWIQFINIFLVYFVTLSVFPTVLAGMQHPKNGEKLESVYIGLTTFLNFNLFAAIGSTTASFVRFPSPRWLFAPVIVRLLFIPFFMLCDYDQFRIMHVVFTNQWWFIIANTVMAFTSGYFSSLGMMYAPGAAPPHLQKTAGQCAALSLVSGIMAGVGFTPAITAMVEHIK